jgi:hypothetical protein
VRESRNRAAWHEIRARWTDEILDEVFRNVRSNNPQIPPDRLERTRELMCEAVADSMRNPPAAFNDVVDTLERTQLPRAAAILRR